MASPLAVHHFLPVEESRMLEQALSSTQESAAGEAAVIVFDEMGRIVSSNAMAQRMLGLSADEMLASNCQSGLATGGLGDTTADPLAAAMGSPLSVMTILDQEGRSLTVNGTCVRLDESIAGKPLVLMIVDKHHATPTAVVSLSSETLADASQQVRMPLCAIAGYLDLLLEQHRTVRRGELAKIVRVLRRNVRWLERIADNLLSALDMYAGRIDLDPKPIHLSGLLEEAAVKVEMLVAGKQQSITTMLPDAGATVIADRRHILQVLVNLLSIAIKNAPQQGQITISTGQSGSQWRVSITDDSPGLPWWDHARVSNGLTAGAYQAASKLDADLGIAIARAVIELHGGTIGLVNTPGKGSTLWFTLPEASVVSHQLSVVSGE